MSFSDSFSSFWSQISVRTAFLRRQLRQEHEVADQTAPADPLGGGGVSAHGGLAQAEFALEQADLALASGAPSLQTPEPRAFLRAVPHRIALAFDWNAHVLNASFLKKIVLP